MGRPGIGQEKRNNEEMTLKKGTFSHGTLYGYRKHGCRCDLCTVKNKEAKQRQRNKRKKTRSIPPDAEHGRAHTYREYGCRCNLCKEEYYSTYARRSERYVNLSLFKAMIMDSLVVTLHSHPDLISEHFDKALKLYRKEQSHALDEDDQR